MVRPSIEARVSAKRKKDKEQESFYINPQQLGRDVKNHIET